MFGSQIIILITLLLNNNNNNNSSLSSSSSSTISAQWELRKLLSDVNQACRHIPSTGDIMVSNFHS